MSVFRRCIPMPMRQAMLKAFRQRERELRIEESAHIPVYELLPRHIAKTSLLCSRSDLLRHLPTEGVVAEIGVDQGEFTQEIMEITKPSRLHLIDAWGSERYHGGKAHAVTQRFHLEIDAGVVQVNRGYSTEVLPSFPDAYFDWVYIDSAHTYETTAAELDLCKAKVKPGGIFCGHDYITSCWRNGVRYGVVEAVHEFCLKNDWELLFLTSETHQHRSYAIHPLRH